MTYIVPFDRVTVDGLVAVTNTHRDILDRIAAADESSNLYIRHSIPKRNGSRRVVFEPTDEVKLCQRALAGRLHEYVSALSIGYPHPAVHGFVPKRNTVTNATKHVAARHIVRVDLKSFFPSIGKAHVVASLVAFRIDPVVADYIASLCTLNNVLAEGLPSSPVLANMACLNLDRELDKLGGSKSTYTRYADDITFSGDETPTLASIGTAISANGFAISVAKTRRSKLGQAHFVTGLAVSEPDHPRVPKWMKRRLRQELYYCRKFGIDSHAERVTGADANRAVNSIGGRICYVMGVEKERGQRYRAQFAEALKADGRTQLVPATNRKAAPSQLCVLVDEGELIGNRLTMCAVLIDQKDATAITRQIKDLLAALNGDPFLAGRARDLAKKGIHFTDNHDEVRSRVIEIFSRLPFRAYVALGSCTNDTYLPVFTSLAHRLLAPRLLRHYQRSVSCIFERNSKVTQASLDRIASAIASNVQARGRRLSYPLSISTGSKQDNPDLALPDYVLGILGAHVADPGADHAAKRFERFRSRIRLIHDMDTNAHFARRTPFVAAEWRKLNPAIEPLRTK